MFVSSVRHSVAKTIRYDPLAYRHVKLLHTVKRKEEASSPPQNVSLMSWVLELVVIYRAQQIFNL